MIQNNPPKANLKKTFDLRPAKNTGPLDVRKIQKAKILPVGNVDTPFCPVSGEGLRKNPPGQKSAASSGQFPRAAYLPVKNLRDKEKSLSEVGWRTRLLQSFIIFKKNKREEKIFQRGIGLLAKRIFVFSSLSAILISGFFFFRFVNQGLKIKNTGLVKGQEAFSNLLAAKDSLKTGDYARSYGLFASAQEKLGEISEQLDGMGNYLVEATKYVPYLSKVSSANHLVMAGNDIAQIGVHISQMLEKIENLKQSAGQGESLSFLSLFKDNENSLEEISALLNDAQNHLEEVSLEDIPQENRDQFIEIKKTLPEVNKILAEFLNEEKIFVDILGGNGPRKYLFLFQNNQEMRATGGFIGTYGLLDMFDGRVRKFFIDGIFNPDGQLRERIVPPAPIQKISANWSLHDSNWFPDFPQSAKKAAWFYEKTGGPTVDGVITMTPSVMQKLLEITGPIEMPEYEVTVDKENFVEKIQFEVEIDYDKELNQPKKILSDLAPKVLDRIFNSPNVSDISKTLKILVESLDEKHILIYSKNDLMQNIIANNGWSGEILETGKDYLSVINSNINGFKTDGVVEEKIFHRAQIQEDGSIVDTLTITRHHKGGDASFDWWNKVNSNYMRVYVPQGATLLSAEGHTRESNVPPLDYDALGYKRDADLQAQEAATRIHEESGTRIYEEGGKTVFANWAYVSPKETVTLTYKYLLPFKIDMNAKDPADTYSLLVQKQSGSIGSALAEEIIYPADYKVLWKYPQIVQRPDDLSEGQSGMKAESVLNLDRFFGLTFSK